MKPLRNFEEFLFNGIVRKQSPDISRAKFLIDEAKLSFDGLKERLGKMGISKKNANSIIKDCYDILMELIRARMLLDGYRAVGQGAHEAEVAYLKVLKFNEGDIDFMNELRYFRNGIVYYGHILDEEYAKKVVSFTKRMYKKLIALLNED
ncbi:MAG: hypothetical protein ACTSVB_09220 [Candidatus Heimdallarchaeaceae archaeon]